jgi:protein required for attachment to host cells
MATTWMLVADSAAARLYERQRSPDWTLVRELAHPESRLHPGDVYSDKPGRVLQSSGQVAGMEPPPYRKLEADKFARVLAEVLERGREAGAFDQLILIAPPPFLGHLRPALAAAVVAKVTHTVEKDYLHLDARALKERLEQELRPR